MKYKDQILKLRQEGKTYTEIQEILGVSKSSISYHCGEGQKSKYLNRQRKNRSKHHPFQRKLEGFIYREEIEQNERKASDKRALYDKLKTFTRERTGMKKRQKLTFTVEDIIAKFGENPKCYLTGQEIDIYDTKSYNFDHIIPVSKGGANTLDNLGICTKQANQCKSDLTPDELYNFCKQIIKIYDNKLNE